jgi:hypothetical protein
MVSKIHTTLASALKESKYRLANAGIDDHSPSSEVWEFRQEIEKTIHLKTAYRDNGSAWVYAEGDLLVAGWVGYGDYQTISYGKKKFIVRSRRISNNKYSSGHDAHNMTMNERLPVAVRNAKKYLTRYSLEDTAKVFVADVRDHANSQRVTANGAYKDARVKIGLDRYDSTRKAVPLVAELCRLVDNEHTFLDTALGTKVQELVSQHREYEVQQAAPSNVPMNFVRVHEKFGQRGISLVHFNDAAAYSPHVDSTYAPFVLEADIPEDIQGKVAVMSMCDTEEFVQDVGYKVNDETFFLYAVD